MTPNQLAQQWADRQLTLKRAQMAVWEIETKIKGGK